MPIPQVYLLQADVDNFRKTRAADKAGRDVLGTLRGEPILHKWKPVRVSMYDTGKPIGDVTSLGADQPVLNPRAIEALRDLIEPYGELLPLDCGRQQWFLYHVTFVVDCFDQTKIEGDRFDDGRLFWIKRYAFIPERIRSLTVFRAPELQGGLFVTDVFKSRVESAGLLGFRLPAIWPREDPWTSPLGP